MFISQALMLSSGFSVRPNVLCISVLSVFLLVSEMSDIVEKDWKSSLTSIIEELKTTQYDKLLQILEKIPPKERESKREEMPQIIIEHYSVNEPISAINNTMEKIPRKDSAVQDLLRPFLDKLGKENKGEFMSGLCRSQ